MDYKYNNRRNNSIKTYFISHNNKYEKDLSYGINKTI